MTALAILKKDEILAKVRDGYILREIASELGISKQAIHQQLKDDPDYKAAKHEQVESMIEEAKEKTWSARDPIDIAHAREVTKFAFRYAESVDPGRWSLQREQGPGALQVIVQVFDKQEEKPVVAVQGKDLT